MIERLGNRVPPFVRRHSIWFEFMTIVLLVAVFLLGVSAISPKNRALQEVCGDLASQVINGEATGFDYMATQCPAWMLMEAEAVAEETR